MSQGTLYIVATPIGNLNDMTLRALEILKSADLILCEDTRVTKKLLTHFQISKPTESYHHHSPESKVKEIIQWLEEGKNLALVTDAGTPGISDPGNRLIQQLSNRCHSGLDSESSRNDSLDSRFRGNDNRVVPIPGPSALVTALSVSGFPTDKFYFVGFPPHKNKRQKYFKELAQKEETVVFYESGHRIKKCLKELLEVLGPDRQVVVCRELTKMFETIYRGTMEEISKMNINEKGEFVVVISSI